MNSDLNRDLRVQEGLLDRIEQALQEKAQYGCASEARHGLLAEVANATPPVNEAFRRTLRARVLAQEGRSTRKRSTRPGRARWVSQWRFALLILGAILLVTLAPTMDRVQIMEVNDAPVGHPGAGRLTGEDFEALAEALNRAPGPRTVVVYPGTASPLVKRVRHETVPLVLGKNTSPAAIDRAVGKVLPSSGFVDLVLAGAEANDTTRQVQAAMEQSLYRLYRSSGQADAETFGALERSTFLAGPANGALEPIGALFEGGIELVAGGVLDDPQPGSPLRMAFEWRVQEPVGDSLVMYVHVVHDGVALIAQRDAVPGNGLLPIEGWRPGETVRDPFALLLPPSLPAGEYEIRVGIYDATTGMRYRLVGPPGGTYVVIRQFEYPPAPMPGVQDAGAQA